MDGLALSMLFLVILSFVLFLIRVGLIFYHNILLSRELKRMSQAAAARRTASPVVATTVNITNEPPKDDLPPAYDEIVKTKLALQAAAEEGRMSANTSSNAQTPIALTTIVDNSSGSRAASSNSIATPRETIASAESYETLPPAYENAVFEHEDSTNSRRENRTSTL